MSGNKCGDNSKLPQMSKEEPKPQTKTSCVDEVKRPKIFQEELQTPTRCRDTTNYFAFRKQIPGCDGQPIYSDDKTVCKDSPSLSKNQMQELGNLKTDGSGVSPLIKTSKPPNQGNAETVDLMGQKLNKSYIKTPKFYGISRAMYSGIMKRTSTFFVGIVFCAIAFESLFDPFADGLFENINKGKLWKDIKSDYERCSENE